MKKISKVSKNLRSIFDNINKPSKYPIWKESFQRLQEERETHGYSTEYWRIWHSEVCPAYREMTYEHRKLGIGYDTLTCQILDEIGKC